MYIYIYTYIYSVYLFIYVLNLFIDLVYLYIYIYLSLSLLIKSFFRAAPCRISDFPHLLGVTRPLAGSEPRSEEIRVWRAGIFKTLKKHLKEKEILKLFINVVYTTRPVPGTIFSVLWRMVLDYLLIRKEDACHAALLSHYLQQDERGSVTATWNTGIHRAIPGTCPSTQSQEAWHRGRLRPSLGKRRQSVASLMVNLETFLQTRAF